MVYVFLSGYADKYRANVLKTVGLPSGLINDYSYKVGSPDGNVNEDSLANALEVPANAEVLFVMIDRYAPGGYTYFPIRTGRLAEPMRVADGRLRLKVKLGQFATGVDNTRFAQSIAEHLAGMNYPQLVSNDPENRQDGQYVLVASPLASESPRLGDEGWIEVVKGLARLQAFRPDDNRGVVFLSAEVWRADEDPSGPLSPTIVDMSRAEYELHAGARYKLHLRYYYPSDVRGRSCQARIALGPSLIALQEPVVSIGANQRLEEWAFAVADYPEASLSRIDLAVEDDPNAAAMTRTLLRPALSFAARLRPSPVRRWLAGVAITAYALGQVLEGLYAHPTVSGDKVWFGAGVVLSIFAVVALLALIGKKPG